MPGRKHVANCDWPGLEAIFLEPSIAVAARSTEIWLQHRKTARRVKLREPIEAPLITSARTAVRQHDSWQALGALDAGRQSKVCGNHDAIRRGITDGLDGCELHPFERASYHQKRSELMRFAIENIVHA